MKAQILKRISPIEEKPLELTDLPVPRPGTGQVLLKVSTCGLCHTELDEIEGRVQPKLPVVLGHEVVGEVVELGQEVLNLRLGDRVGVAWIHSACGKCRFCHEGKENLCPDFKATGCHEDGGYAEYMVVAEDFAYPIPGQFTDSQAAPLLCAGAVGYRALNLTGIENGKSLGLYGFGASAHIVIQIAKYRYPESPVFVFTRGEEHQELARQLGADWVGAPKDIPPQKIDFCIDFTPVGETIAIALSALEKGGRLVINAIRKRDNAVLDYATHLWHEKEIKSVANITAQDVREFLALAAEIPIVPEVQEFGLEEANEALLLLKQGMIQGAGVLRVSHRAVD